MLNYFLVTLGFSLFILLPVKVRITIVKNRDNEYILVEMLGFKIIKIFFKTLETKIFELEINRDQNNPKQAENDILLIKKVYEIIVDARKAAYNQNKNFKKINKLIFKHVNIVCTNIYVAFGSGNAALTGLLAGKTWSIIYLVLGVLAFYFDFHNSNIKVNVAPIFQKYEPIQIDANCIFRLKVGHIIIACSAVFWYRLMQMKLLKRIDRKSNKKGRKNNG